MMRILFIFLFFISCNSNRINDDRVINELVKNKNKLLCLNGVEEAKEEIKINKIVVSNNVYLASGTLRFEEELKFLCKENGLLFSNNLIGCEFPKESSCYSDYMDYELAKRFGENFKSNLYKKADSIYVNRISIENILIEKYELDVKPEPINCKLNSDLFINDIDLKIKNDNKPPIVDFYFIVEKNGTSSNFKVNYVSNLKDKELKESLSKKVINYIKNEYPIWKPGLMLDKPIRTKYNYRVAIRNN